MVPTLELREDLEEGDAKSSERNVLSHSLTSVPPLYLLHISLWKDIIGLLGVLDCLIQES